MNNIKFVVFIALFISCCNSNVKKENKKSERIFRIISPQPLQLFSCNQTILFQINPKDKNIKIDSILLINRDKKKIYASIDKNSFIWQPEDIKMGLNSIQLKIYYNNKKEEHLVNINFKSDIEPKNLKYKIIKKYPHDTSSYTQGLLWNNGFMYESTGRKKMSAIKKINIENNTVVSKYLLPDNYFAEGIALINNKIYQITWQEKTGFIYDPDNLELLKTFSYSINEGWGLTSDSNYIYMSDGSNLIYVLDPANFSQIDIIEVYDNNGKVTKINELEHVNNEILANIYGEKYIIFIEKETGKVLKKIDFSDIVPEKYNYDYDHVLNGIAYNNKNNHFYITGKLWEYIYEIIIYE